MKNKKIDEQLKNINNILKMDKNPETYMENDIITQLSRRLSEIGSGLECYIFAYQINKSDKKALARRTAEVGSVNDCMKFLDFIELPQEEIKLLTKRIAEIGTPQDCINLLDFYGDIDLDALMLNIINKGTLDDLENAYSEMVRIREYEENYIDNKEWDVMTSILKDIILKRTMKTKQGQNNLINPEQYPNLAKLERLRGTKFVKENLKRLQMTQKMTLTMAKTNLEMSLTEMILLSGGEIEELKKREKQ